MEADPRPRPAYERQYERAQHAARKREVWSATAWSESPVPFTDESLPAFPTDLLPKWGADYVEAVAETTETPLDLGGMLYLGTLSTALAKKIRIRVTPDWSESVNLYCLVVLGSGEGKSTVFKHFLEPVHAVQAEDRERKRPELAKLIAKRRGLEASIKEAERKVGKASKADERQRWQSELERLNQELDRLPHPISPLYVAEDSTPEALASLLFDHEERMAVLSAEGCDVLQIMAGRYSNSPNIGIYLKGYTGDPTTIHRRGREEILNEPILTLVFTIQPGVLPQLVGNAHFRDRGLVGRFLYSTPNSKLGRRRFLREPVAEEVRRLYREKISGLMRLPDMGEIKVPAAAFDELLILFASVEKDLDHIVGKYASMQEWVTRITGTAARIAALLHLAEDGGTEIGKGTMKRAIELTQDYLLPHAKRAYAVLEADEKVSAAKKLLQVIAAKKWEEFGGRELHQAARGQSRFKKREGIDEALKVLEGLNYVKSVPGGKDLWAVHPRWDWDNGSEDVEDR